MSNLGVPLDYAEFYKGVVDYPIEFQGQDQIVELGIIRKEYVYVATNTNAFYIIEKLDNIKTIAVNHDGYLLFFLNSGEGRVYGKIAKA